MKRISFYHKYKMNGNFEENGESDMILDENVKIWVYGYGTRSRTVVKRLAEEGLQVYGFMDQKPEQYQDAKKTEMIVKPEMAEADENAIVICTVANVFSHEEIAANLEKRGFQYIIYKTFHRNQAAKDCSSLYDDLTEIYVSGTVRNREIPLFSEVCRPPEETENGGDTVCMNIPVELLFGPTRERFEESSLEKNEKFLQETSDRSFLYCTLPKWVMWSFMQEFDKNTWSRVCELWLANRNAFFFKSKADGSFDEENHKKHIEERYRIFQKMEKLFHENPAFFSENPASVVWNKKGFFNILDGNNRAGFLLAKGMNHIPAKMSKSDYQMWMRVEKTAEAVWDAYRNLGGELRAPILHPIWKDIPCTLEFYSHKKVAIFSAWLWKRQIEPVGMHVCEYDCRNDLCGSHLARMGADLTVVDSGKQLRLHEALDQLYHLKNCRYREQIEENGVFQMILSNEEGALEEFSKKEVRSEWYILEYIDREDAEIESLLAHFSSEKPEFLMCQQVGTKVYKVVALKGGV